MSELLQSILDAAYMPARITDPKEAAGCIQKICETKLCDLLKDAPKQQQQHFRLVQFSKEKPKLDDNNSLSVEESLELLLPEWIVLMRRSTDNMAWVTTSQLNGASGKGIRRRRYPAYANILYGLALSKGLLVLEESSQPGGKLLRLTLSSYFLGLKEYLGDGAEYTGDFPVGKLENGNGMTLGEFVLERREIILDRDDPECVRLAPHAGSALYSYFHYASLDILKCTRNWSYREIQKNLLDRCQTIAGRELYRD